MYYTDSQPNQQPLCHASTCVSLAVPVHLCYTQRDARTARERACPAPGSFASGTTPSEWNTHDYIPGWFQVGAPGYTCAADVWDAIRDAGGLWIHTRRGPIWHSG